MQPVNSRPYWDGRFDAEWEALRGRDQSRFVASLAVAMWPAWLSQRQCAQAWTLCDWGCAMGDGTDELAQALGLPCTGVDFSDVAVRKAAQSYPGSRFVADDWLQPGGGGDPHRWDRLRPTRWNISTTLAGVCRTQSPRRPLHRALAAVRGANTGDRPSTAIASTATRCSCARHRNGCSVTPPCRTSGLHPWPGQQVLLTYGRCSELVPWVLSTPTAGCRASWPDAQAIERQRAPDLAEALRQRDLASAKLGELLQAHHRLLAETVQAPARASGWRRWLGL
jgi:hypothetical protein